ncbi:MAG: NAD(P) transhydrogenase subunit alpha [bacterium]|jgi:NAD(P) transhydrogenase subunit alpha|nr:NAD(P) transhydrogenase subunit alpha [bacterium]
MTICVPVEGRAQERRAPLLPVHVRQLVELGATLEVESGLGAGLGIADEDYRLAGATIGSSRAELLARAGLVLRLGKPPREDVAALAPGTVHISYLDPFRDRALLQAMAERGLSAVCMEMIPRTTLAQKMDALSSQASLAGYAAVLLAAFRLNRILPMMMTPAGTITPAKVFIIGAGVAGLQAIATARRLGARVEAFDTRPVVREQVESLGGRFVEIDLGETGQTKDGYARELTPEQVELQRKAMARHCAQADIVITTAQVFGRSAPRLLTLDMVRGMKPGSVVVDMAVETGGNVEGSVAGEEVDLDGVLILGPDNLPGQVALHATQMYGSNLLAFIEHFWDKDSRTLRLDREDEIMRGALVCHGGAVVHEALKA